MIIRMRTLTIGSLFALTIGLVAEASAVDRIMEPGYASIAPTPMLQTSVPAAAAELPGSPIRMAGRGGKGGGGGGGGGSGKCNPKKQICTGTPA